MGAMEVLAGIEGVKLHVYHLRVLAGIAAANNGSGCSGWDIGVFMGLSSLKNGNSYASPLVRLGLIRRRIGRRGARLYTVTDSGRALLASVGEIPPPPRRKNRAPGLPGSKGDNAQIDGLGLL